VHFVLKSLFGCKSVEQILLYLLVNEKGYAHQLHQILPISLTPIQKALTRLEEGEILISTYEGKIRLYQFNPAYPLLNELEMLLKRAFHQLPPHEKKRYYYLKQLRSRERKEQYELLQYIWNQLLTITSVTWVAKSHSKQTKEWNRKGNGKVTIKQDGQTLIFNEQGKWREDQGDTHHYSNRFRWIWSHLEGMLSLEHLRFGETNPVFLFHLVPTKVNLLESLNSHLCGEDTYFGWLQYSNLFLQLNFRTIGPKKNEEIEYVYT
jgi:hypothetical protein